MPEADTMPSLMMMTTIVSEESLVRDAHTERQTDFGLVYLKLRYLPDKGVTDGQTYSNILTEVK